MLNKENTPLIIDSIREGKRISTMELLKEINHRLEEGVTDFIVNASGQHNIGGPVWNKNNDKITFVVKNPGQRAGSMGMENTSITIEGSAPADVGWLNAGAEIILKGDGGDTTAHCASTGKIYVSGRVGTRSGALMKHDPKFSPPELWVLKNTGSFSFEFMGGGIAVICGYNCDNIKSVLGNRSCVGMLGGTIYVRGNTEDLSDDTWILGLDTKDIKFLNENIPLFLDKIEKKSLSKELTNYDSWKKIVAKTHEEREIHSLMPIKDFRKSLWVPGGIFGDLIEDDLYVAEYVQTGDLRLRYPEWRNNNYMAPCEYNCPINIPTAKRISLLREDKTKEALNMVLDFSPFPASVCGQVCPNLCAEDCNRKNVDIPVKIGELGTLSNEIKIKFPPVKNREKIAIIGAGSSGLSAAWHLRKMGYAVDLFEQDKNIGGKLKQVIPEDRLSREILDTELNRFKIKGIAITTNKKVDEIIFNSLLDTFDAVVIAVGTHIPIIIPVKGHEKLIMGLDFLKMINSGKNPEVGDNVVVIGAGNAGMDVVLGAYKMGAKKVTAVDIQKPAAFEKEMDEAKNLGADILWPCYTEKITDKGVYLKDGTVIKADTVIVSVGDRSDFSFLKNEFLDDKGKIVINDFDQVEANKKVFVIGDAIKLGLFTHAIADGRKVAINIDNMFSGNPMDDFKLAPLMPKDKIKKEYYHPLNEQAVIKMNIEDEKLRCMSCGLCRDCYICLESCPEQAISRLDKENNSYEYKSDPNKCIGCGICAGVCPCGIWEMTDNVTGKYIEA